MHVQIVLFDGFDPLDVIAPYEVLHAGGSAFGGVVTVELVSAEGPREVVSGTGGLALRATSALDPDRPGPVLVPGASGPLGEPGETPDQDAGAEAHWQQDEFIPVLLGRTPTTELPRLLKAAIDNPRITMTAGLRRLPGAGDGRSDRGTQRHDPPHGPGHAGCHRRPRRARPGGRRR